MFQSGKNGNGTIAKNAHKEERYSWQSGSLLMRTQGTEANCARDFFRNDIAMGIILHEDSGSEVKWRLDGRTVLNKTWSPTSRTHDLMVLPPGCELQCRCSGGGQGLWLFLDTATVADNKQVKSFAQ